MAAEIRRDIVTAREADKRLRKILEYVPQVPDKDGTLDDKVKLFDRFIEAGGFYPIYMRTMHDLARPMTDENIVNFEKRFAALLYERLAYFYMQHRDIGPVLSPEDTRDFFQWLHPGAIMRRDNFGFDSLMGITVPDGLVLEEQRGLYRPILVCEYTCSSDPAYFAAKFDAFNIQGRKISEVFGESQQLLVVPQGLDPAKIVQHPDFAVEFAPFNRRDLRKFADELFSATVPERGLPTVAEYFKRYKGRQLRLIHSVGKEAANQSTEVHFSSPRLVHHNI